MKKASPQSIGSFREDPLSGDHSEVEPPGPIPNPEVKRFSANGSETIGLVRVGRRQVYAPHFGNKVRGSFFVRGGGVPASLPHPARELRC